TGAQTETEQTTETEQSAESEQSQEQSKAPESYEAFTAPEGQEFDAEIMDTFGEAAREADLTQDQAQAFLDKMSPALQQRQMAQLDSMREQWAEQSRNDKDLNDGE